MKKIIFIVIVFTIILFIQNCSGGSVHSSLVPSANTNPTREYSTPSVFSKGGFFFHKTYVPGPLGINAEAHYEGKSCSHTFLYLVSSGDSSIEAAKRNGNIKKIAYLDYEQIGIAMGVLYHRVCTIIKGS
ncbi:TRL-like family protein [Leptospira noumeaensis]|uniref:TRL-like family protein n=1 Tax=Leptospira noumeaensis TaxID=2484964 RepID=A0A4R9I7W6_9LEPT|nr:TRL-like family protein [Leptospira noumeaensis]TGK82248.1 TRL-like family protein [Leptospira noumeaensis]